MRFNKARWRPLKIGFLALLLAQLNVSAYAGEKENRIIDKAIQAYGGDKLIHLKSLRYTDNIDHYFSHQSGHSLQGPITQHLNKVQIELTMDIEKQRSEFKRLTKLIVGYHDRKNVTATHRIFSNGKGYNVDHFLEEYQISDRISFGNVDLGYSQMLDPIIVKKLANERSKANWVDTAFIHGQAHDVLTVNADTQQEYSVYINKKSGLLSRMLQKRGSSLRSYNFLQHQHSGDVVWAKQMFVGTEKQPIYHTNNRNLQVNIKQEPTFDIPVSYKLSDPVKPFDISKLTIRELAKGVFFVGQDWGYTLFIDAGDHYTSAGAWGMTDRSDDWKKALELLYETTGSKKPVKFHLVSHHHTDHMSELHDVLDHGAKIVVHPTDIASVKRFLNDKEVKDEQFFTVDKNTYLADGKILIFDAPSSQASHNLSLYLPEHKIVFSEDFFGSSFLNSHHSPTSWPHMDTYQRLEKFTKKLQELNITANQYVSSHHGRVLSHEDIVQASMTKLPSTDVLLKRLFQ